MEQLSRPTREWLWQLFGPDSKIQVDMTAVDRVVEIRAWLVASGLVDVPAPAGRENGRRGKDPLRPAVS